MDHLKQSIRSFVIVNFLFGRDPGLDDSASLLGNAIVDSTGVLELVSFLEEKYSIKVEDEELLPENLDSIDKVAAYLSRKGVINA